MSERYTEGGFWDPNKKVDAAFPTPTPSPGREYLGRVWNLMADAMHSLDAMTGSTPVDEVRKSRVYAMVEEAHRIAQAYLAIPSQVPGEAP